MQNDHARQESPPMSPALDTVPASLQGGPPAARAFRTSAPPDTPTSPEDVRSLTSPKLATVRISPNRPLLARDDDDDAAQDDDVDNSSYMDTMPTSSRRRGQKQQHRRTPSASDSSPSSSRSRRRDQFNCGVGSNGRSSTSTSPSRTDTPVDPPQPGQEDRLRRSSSVRKLTVLTTETRDIATDVATHHLDRIRSTLAAWILPAHSRAYYEDLLRVATSYEQWSAAATTLDRLDGRDEWKRDPVSDLYDYKLLQERLTGLQEAREANDLPQLILLLRTSLSRNLGGMGNPILYGFCKSGTKHLIEAYNREVVKCLDIICSARDGPMALDDRARMEFFLNTRQSFGRTALLLSGGATLALHHIGVVKALHETRLLPRIISGASGGSIIASFVCTHTDDEFDRLLNPAYTRLDFFDTSNQNTIFHMINRFMKTGVLFDVETLINTLKLSFGDMTFVEAYNRTRRILNITVSSATRFEMPRLLNYITSPNVYIWSAVAASCSVPLVFKSAPLLAKDRNGRAIPWNPSGHRWIDGSVESDLPMQKLSELFNVNHFIVCQVNPHVVPFLHKGLVKSVFRQACESILTFSRNEFTLRCNQLRELGLLPELLYRVQSIVSQTYQGDLTIIPDLTVTDWLHILTNPTPKAMLEATLKGERATWPKISIMQNHLQIEMALDEMLYRCRLHALSRDVEPAVQALQNAARGLVPSGWGMRQERDREFGVENSDDKPRIKSAVNLGTLSRLAEMQRVPPGALADTKLLSLSLPRGVVGELTASPENADLSPGDGDPVETDAALADLTRTGSTDLSSNSSGARSPLDFAARAGRRASSPPDIALRAPIFAALEAMSHNKHAAALSPAPSTELPDAGSDSDGDGDMDIEDEGDALEVLSARHMAAVVAAPTSTPNRGNGRRVAPPSPTNTPSSTVTAAARRELADVGGIRGLDRGRLLPTPPTPVSDAPAEIGIEDQAELLGGESLLAASAPSLLAVDAVGVPAADALLRPDVGRLDRDASAVAAGSPEQRLNVIFH
ncbi:hypothetical protein AMAG_01815 [Allomyces macrogynus ATCC 38327]|uniref:PNPLA domain-containing protein n=1 Tax=Allomyces macrogynus (strain ATCC 38327) TaxID=578462 RepID=A0A0L0S0V0_ALLM3|nr:hypothetical protein AMAG_01815 [Allomyces macrogynus ATCC 38327]|eukprot:KNE55964.1 hypothetical protein AMAG_01815 [Allomyces macrogynus ATCC 38327]